MYTQRNLFGVLVSKHILGSYIYMGNCPRRVNRPTIGLNFKLVLMNDGIHRSPPVWFRLVKKFGIQFDCRTVTHPIKHTFF